ncbi:MAG: hypothetical protein SGILL_004138 [Bacillariaceae sp.]
MLTPKASPKESISANNKGVLKVPIRSPRRRFREQNKKVERSPITPPKSSITSPRAKQPKNKVDITPYSQARKNKMMVSPADSSSSISQLSRTLRLAINDDAFGHQSEIIKELIDGHQRKLTRAVLLKRHG